MDSDKRIKLVRIASLTALIGNIIICIAKLVIGIYAQSLSVLGDGIDSATDVIISVITLVVSFIINRPSDKEHPWGHQRAETMAALILSFIMSAVAHSCISLMFLRPQRRPSNNIFKASFTL